MRGLIKNNFYASLSNVKFFSAILLLLGLFVTAVDNEIPTLLIGYMFLSMIGFSVNAAAGMRKEGASKWEKYKLTVPVKRTDIIKSYFFCQLLHLGTGVVFTAVCVSLSVLLHGFPFDRSTDVLMLFTAGICVSLFMSAVFLPCFYLGGDERNEAVLIISLLCGAGIFMGLVSLENRVFGPQMTVAETLAAAGILLCCAFAAFGISYPLTAGIFKKKEY